MMIAFALLASAPAPPARFSAFQVRCSGGVAGRTTTTRLAADGQVSRSDRYDRPPSPVGRVTVAEARTLSDRLDRVDFQALKTLPRNRTLYDGISCSLTRFGPPSHTLEFLAGAQAPAPSDKARYQEASAVMSAIQAAAARVALNPQPIPPEKHRRPNL